MGSKKQKLLNQALSYESDKEAIYKKSEKKAWIIAITSTALLFFSLISLFFLMPLKEVQPYLLGFDKSSGIVDPITTLNKETVSEEEAIHKYFIRKYILNREDYNYQTVQRLFNLTQLHSTKEVAESFVSNYDLAEKFGVYGQVKTQINSIVLEESNGAKMATVRVQITESLENKELTQNYTIRMSYDFYPLEIPNSYRLENPLGFLVTSYRKIEEFN